MPNERDENKLTLRHGMKSQEPEDKKKKKILNALREKKEVTYKRLGVKIILDFITAGS